MEKDLYSPSVFFPIEKALCSLTLAQGTINNDAQGAFTFPTPANNDGMFGAMQPGASLNAQIHHLAQGAGGINAHYQGYPPYPQMYPGYGPRQAGGLTRIPIGLSIEPWPICI